MSSEILIVGAGPTGLTAAMELSRFGLHVRLVDKRDAPATTSRAIGVQARTLELLEQRGLAEDLIKLGNPARFGSVYGGGQRVVHLDFAHVESTYPYLLFVSQAETERLLREKAESQGVKPEWNTELIAVAQGGHSQSDKAVTAILKNPDGTIESAQYNWLIDAEGSGSLVRHTLDLSFEGRTRSEDYVLGDGHIDGNLPDTDFHIFSSPHGFMGLFPMGNKRFRLIASNPLSKPSKTTAPTPDEIQRIYDQRSHIPAKFTDVTWTSWFCINSRMVSKLKTGHFLLGGDSAHIHSPAGAQGMNTGIQDMINLGWKLALVAQGKASPELLETYEAERIPVMRGVLSNTENLTNMIGTDDHVVRTLFNHFGPWIGSKEIVQEKSTNQMAQLTIEYKNSPLSVNSHFEGELRGGDRLPNFQVSTEEANGSAKKNLHSFLDPSGFTLIASAESTAEAQTMLNDELKSALEKCPAKISIVSIHPNEAEPFRKLFGKGSNAVLVRPDGYVAVVSNAANLQKTLSAFIERWFTTQTTNSD